jgi:flagellar biosynthetic protein FliO
LRRIGIAGRRGAPTKGWLGRFADVIRSLAGQKKRLVLVLVVAGLCGVAAVVQRGRLSARAEMSVSELSATGDSASEAGSFFGNDPNLFAGSGDKLGSSELVIRMLVMVLIVVVLGAAAIYVSKRYLPKLTNLPGKQIRVIETTHLGPRRALHLVEVNGRRLLLGGTTENIRVLADLSYGFSETELSVEKKDFQAPVGSFGSVTDSRAEGGRSREI